TPISTRIDESGLTSDLSRIRKLTDFAQQNIRILHDIDTQIASRSAASRQELHTFNRQVDGLLSEVREVMLVPAASVLMFLPLAVQEMAASMGKEAELVIEGGNLLVDRRILEGMKDPLIHLVRNAVDHGIEQPEVRIRAGKSVKGIITVSLIEIAGNRIKLIIKDDGRGIDIGKVKAAAQKRGIMETSELERMGENEIVRLLFRSGLSTSAIITELSGRGLGLSIVEERAQQYDGNVSIETNPGQGTHVQITLPVRLATLRGVIVRTGDHLLIVPIVCTEQVLRVDEQDVQLMEDQRTIRYQNEAIPLICLTALLGLPHTSNHPSDTQVRYAVVIASGGIRIAIEVDEIIREQELSQKSLGPQLARVSTIAGATITGNGKIIPVLNVVDLVKIATRGGLPSEMEQLTEGEKPAIRTLLIVEDSITARMLLKNILQAAGYKVKTAVDGMEAWTVLKTDPIDLVVSDIEMPRMNGFDLTTAIRHDRDLADLPVVLVTALASRKDRERGIDTGANAYIVKSSFDQSNLLDIIGRLIG
ncbi:MAG: response regulator, partial [Methanobacteriota archaeon]